MLLRQLGASTRLVGAGIHASPHVLRSRAPGCLRQFRIHPQHQPRRPSLQAVSLPRATSRAASTASAFSSFSSSRTTKRLRNFILTTALITTLAGGYILATDTRSSLHTYLVPPLLRLLFPGPAGAEPAHAFGVQTLSRLYSLHIPLHDRSGFLNPFDLSITLFGHPLTSPLGIPAGLDKHADAVDALFAADPGLGVLEVGCVTPKPQPGNPGVRVWRLKGSEGMLNRYGFNSVGSVEVARRLRERVRRFALEHHVSAADVVDGLLPLPGDLQNNGNNKNSDRVVQQPLPASLIPGRLLAVQIGKNATTPADDLPRVVEDYVFCVNTLGPYADLLVVNVSSPNTPGLRTLQSRAPLTQILSAVVDAAERVPRRVKPKVLVKVSPDEDTQAQIADICKAIAASGVSGVIVANTTTRRHGLLGVGVVSAEERVVKEEAGGVSGPTLYPRMKKLVGRYRRELDDMGLRGDGVGVVVVGCGGVRRGDQVVEVMNKGAAGVWLYTGIVYGGVGTLGRVAREVRGVIRGGLAAKAATKVEEQGRIE
ncbi:orotate reductase [Tirmania nivea]|nr:orotate reductase [Tirmania nivea]